MNRNALQLLILPHFPVITEIVRRPMYGCY
jgi:hypothetical protein